MTARRTGSAGRGGILADTLWSYGAMTAMAAAGLALNLLIAAFSGATALGVFNQIYAVFVIAGQLAALGLHDSVQVALASRNTPRRAGYDDTSAAIVLSALVAGLMNGLLAAGMFYLLAPAIGSMLDSAPVAAGLSMAAPGLGLFILNKVGMGVLQGQLRLRLLARLQILRIGVLFAAGLWVVLARRDPALFGLAFSAGELALSLPLTWYVWPKGDGGEDDGSLRLWLRRHYGFGLRALSHGLLSEAYIRIDVLMLGFFAGDAEVGVYSFAALFIEGLFQVAVVIRTVINPRLAALLARGERIVPLLRRAGGAAFIICTGTALLLWWLLPLAGMYFVGDVAMAARPVFAVLAAGMCVYALLVPADQMLLQGGYPGRQSLLMVWNVLMNAVLNFLLIPLYGAMGAAMATAAAFVLAALGALIAAGWTLRHVVCRRADPR